MYQSAQPACLEVAAWEVGKSIEQEASSESSSVQTLKLDSTVGAGTRMSKCSFEEMWEGVSEHWHEIVGHAPSLLSQPLPLVPLPPSHPVHVARVHAPPFPSPP